MNNTVAEVADNTGSWIDVGVIPGTPEHPQLVTLAINDETHSITALTIEQVDALIKALTDAIGGPY